jgi:hypothetical protein
MADTTLPALLDTGNHAGRPAASAVGTGALYSCTDHDLIYQTDGSSWTTWADITGGASDLAGQELNYVAFTSDVLPTNSAEASADTVVTSGSVAYDGSTIVQIEFYSPDVGTPSVSGSTIILLLYEDSTLLGRIAVIRTVAASQLRLPVRTALRRTPSNASHTYTVKAIVSSTTGGPFVTGGAGGAATGVAGFIRITRVSS